MSIPFILVDPIWGFIPLDNHNEHNIIDVDYVDVSDEVMPEMQVSTPVLLIENKNNHNYVDTNHQPMP